jgi:AcrR family transcriptional regulator
MSAAAALLRARSRDALRARIYATAMELFLSRGFDRTTVLEIAAAVPVSARTILRYFPSKEAIVLAPARPAEESPLTAARRTVIAAMQLLAEDGGDDALQTALRLVARTPDLAAKLVLVRREGTRRLGAGIAQRPRAG